MPALQPKRLAGQSGYRSRINYSDADYFNISAHRSCIAYHDADLETLTWTRGRELAIILLASRLKRPRRNSRQIDLVDEKTGEPLMNPVIPALGFKTADALRYLAKIKRQRDRQGGPRI